MEPQNQTREKMDQLQMVHFITHNTSPPQTYYVVWVKVHHLSWSIFFLCDFRQKPKSPGYWKSGPP